MTIYCYKGFNNYFNRKLKGQNIHTITDFVAEFGEFDYIESDTASNFAEKDGVYTSHVLGRQNNPYFGECDYLLVSENNIDIDSKWFIIDQEKRCYGQYNISLYRDVLADNWSLLEDAPMFIEKATLSDNDPLIYNQEAITTNQIKKEEILLQDESKLGWLVCYMNKEYATNSPINININAVPDYTVPSYAYIKNDVCYGLSENTDYRYILEFAPYYFTLYCRTNQQVIYKVIFKLLYELQIEDYYVVSSDPPDSWMYIGTPTELYNQINNLFSITDTTNISEIANDEYAAIPYNENSISLNYLNAKIVQTTNTDLCYKIDATIQSNSTNITFDSASNTSAYIANKINSISHYGYKVVTTTDAQYYTYKYVLNTVGFGDLTINFGDANNRIHCRDVFDLLCIPYGNVIIQNSLDNNWTDIIFDKEIALTVMHGIIKALGSNVYDAQLLPYCPMTTFDYSEITLDSKDYVIIDIKSSQSSRYRKIKDTNDQAKCIALFSASNKGTKILNYNINVTNKKMQNQTQIIRLCSPNNASQFDFNAAKNNGVDYFNVDYNYLPYNPYIHVAPIWKESGIYGNDYNDAKGLICAGDFSISYLSDKWSEYQIQNKNFNNIFDRGTQNLETNYKYQRMQSVTNMVTGAVGAGVGIGALVGGPIGLAVGAIAGGMSAAAGSIDLKIQKDLHNESMDYRKDLFNMQLDNIKALPDTITKVTAINENNKIFPFIEIYDCTDREKEAVANKIAWNGMTVGVIGTINDYINNTWSYGGITDKGYIKGQLIRAEGLDNDTHVLNAIANELNKGVYTK